MTLEAQEGGGHTPGEWSIRTNDFTFQIVSADGIYVASTSWHNSIRKPYPLKPEAKANVRRIVTAVNSHDALLEALKGLMPTNLCADNPNVPDDTIIPVDLTYGELRAARAAIQLAEGR